MHASHTDLATQMRYLTDVGSSQRSSKVLSWISESGEMFDLEGAGQLYTSAREMSESDGCKIIVFYISYPQNNETHKNHKTK